MLRKLTSLLLLVCFGGSTSAQTAGAQTQGASAHAGKAPAQAQTQSAKPLPFEFGLEDGTPVKLRLTRNLSSANDKKGDTVDFEVLEDVAVQNIVVIPRGSIALATITEAEHKKSMGRGGKLNVNIDSVRLRDGERVTLRAVKDNQAGGHVGAMTGAIVATSIVFFPAAPLFLFMHGKDMNIPKGTEITAYVDSNVPLERAKFDDKVAAEQKVAAAAAATTAAQPSVSVSSNPSAADVEVDGSFVGNTPSQLQLAPGDHTVKVSKAGYKPWERKLKVGGGNVNITAELEQEPKAQ